MVPWGTISCPAYAYSLFSLPYALSGFSRPNLALHALTSAECGRISAGQASYQLADSM